MVEGPKSRNTNVNALKPRLAVAAERKLEDWMGQVLYRDISLGHRLDLRVHEIVGYRLSFGRHCALQREH